MTTPWIRGTELRTHFAAITPCKAHVRHGGRTTSGVLTFENALEFRPTRAQVSPRVPVEVGYLDGGFAGRFVTALDRPVDGAWRLKVPGSAEFRDLREELRMRVEGAFLRFHATTVESEVLDVSSKGCAVLMPTGLIDTTRGAPLHALIGTATRRPAYLTVEVRNAREAGMGLSRVGLRFCGVSRNAREMLRALRLQKVAQD